MTAVKLRAWRGVKPVAGPAGVAITTRLRTTPEEERVLEVVAKHLGTLRRADLARLCHPVRLGSSQEDVAKHQLRRSRLNNRKKALTTESSARWANAIIAKNDVRCRLARDAQRRQVVGLRAAIATIKRRVAQPTIDTLTPEERMARRKAKLPKGYPTQAERFQKQRRLQVLQASLRQLSADCDHQRVRVTEGGKQLAKSRQNLDTAKMTLSGWRERWDCATGSRPLDRVMSRSEI